MLSEPRTICSLQFFNDIRSVGKLSNRRDHGLLSQIGPESLANSLCRLKKKNFYTRCAGLSVYMRSLQSIYFCSDLLSLEQIITREQLPCIYTWFIKVEEHISISWNLNFTRGILQVLLVLLLQRLFYFLSYFQQLFPVFIHLYCSARISKRLRRPGIDSKELIPPGWESILGLLKRFTGSGSDWPPAVQQKYLWIAYTYQQDYSCLT